MISSKMEYEADLHDSIISVTPESSSSCYQNCEIENNGGAKTRRTINKLRSIKLVKLPSVRLRPRQAKIHSDSLQLNQVEMSDASPNYMKTTTSSTAKKDNLQKSARTLTRRSSFMLSKSLSRLPSTKFRRPLMRKSSGGSDLRKKMKKSKSIKLRNRSDAENAQCQASTPASNSSLIDDDASNKSLKVITRSSSMRPLRMLKKMSSLRTNRSSMKKSSQMLERNIHRATCSSTLKGSKFPNRLEIQPGGSESEGISTMKVCPYTYCSLHGHRHSTLPPLQRFVSMRRRVLKTQRSKKLERQSSLRAKRSSNVKKAIRGRQTSSYKDASVLETASTGKVLTTTRKMAGTRADLNREDICDGDGESTSCSGSVTGDVVSELTAPLLFMQEDLQLGDLPTEERHAVTGEKEDGSAKSDSPMNVLNATEKADIASSHEEVPETEKVHHDVNEDKTSTLNLELCEGDLALIYLEENSSTAVVSRTINNTSSSAPICQQIEDESAACEEKNGDYFPKRDSESDYDTRVEDKTQMGKQKHMGLWNLIYNHMAFGIAAEDEVQAPATETDKEEGEDADTCPRTNKSGSSDFSGIDHGLDVDNDHEKGSNIHLYQRNAIKLVKEAFDKILSEIPDQSPDDQSSDNGSTLNKESAEINHDEGEELSISASFNLRKEDMAQEPEKIMLKADKSNGPEAAKAQLEMGSKSKQQTPSNWSNLKKIIVLNRFVKALDKVRKFNPRKPRFLPVPIEPDAEKLHLRHQTWEERKRSEEWMLDYALRQVISTLAPSQKRKVALLVQAFESVGPLPDIGVSPSSKSDASSHATPVESCIGSPYQKSAGKGKETKFGISLRETSFPNKRSDDNLHHVNDSCTRGEQDPDCCSELKELNLDCSCTNTALSSQLTAAGLKENFGDLNLDNNDHDSIIQDDQPDSITCCLVQVGEPNIRETTSPKLADLANTLNDVLVNREVSDSEVPDLDLVFDDQHDIANTTNDVIGNGEVSASEVRHLDLGFNDQHDIEDTSHHVVANEEVAASEVHDIDLVFGDQHDIANTSNDLLSNGEVSASEVRNLGLGFGDQHDTANTSDDVLGNGEVAASEVCDLDLGFNDQHDAANTSKDVLAYGEVSSSEVHNLDLGFNDQHGAANTLKDVLANRDGSSSEVHDLDLGFNRQQLPSNPQINEGDEQLDDPQNQILRTSEGSSANGDVNSLVPVPERVEKSSEVTKGETVVNNKFLQLIPPHEESKFSSTDLTHEKQKNMGLWYLIYKHMVSGTTTLLNEAGDEEEQGNHMIVSHEINNKDVDHHVAGCEKVDFQQIEAIRMVEEAIDEIPLPDSQDDSPDDQPITSDIIANQEHLKKQPGRVSVRTEVIKSTALDAKEPCLDSDDTASGFGEVNKTKQKTQKGWSNLKKMILLRRFVKALEKVKNFNPREPQFLPLESEKEAEKVLLRHQDMEDRKNADEWMLDYALQQVVAKLTPARKRKVQLLVEAFETVIPTIES